MYVSKSNKIYSKMGTIGERLKEERGRLGFSQAVLGEKCGTQRTTQIRYESNDYRPDCDYLVRLHQLGGDVMYVLTGVRLGDSDIEKAVGVNEGNARYESGKSAVDSKLLAEAIDLVDEGLGSAGRTFNRKKKAELIAVVYSMLSDPSESSRSSILRVVSLVA